MSRDYLQQVLIGVDQLANTIFAGWADETISARVYRSRHKRKWYYVMKFIDALFFMQKNHCYHAYMAEVERKQHAPNSYPKA